jgi:hypothetical protein
MKRYIEIVYDNSGSMNYTINGRAKYEIALELFEKSILPTIGKKDDQVVLRLLRKDCGHPSAAHKLINDKKSMLQALTQVTYDQSTPLFHTIYDSIKECKNQTAHEYLIFVLTDGDDTCNVNISNLIDQDLIDKYVINYSTIITQLAISSSIGQNNITSFANKIGAQTVLLDSDDNITVMKDKLNKALKIKGFFKNYPLDHCFESKPGFDVSWEDLETLGIEYYQVWLMYTYEFIKWNPESIKHVSATQVAELEFLHGLMFKTSLPYEYVKSMLSSLKAPYYYSHNCIYWDFTTAKWKYFSKPNVIAQQHNPDAKNEDNLENFNELIDNNRSKDLYIPKEVYEVVAGNTANVSFSLISRNISEFNVELKLGDRVVFKRI